MIKLREQECALSSQQAIAFSLVSLGALIGRAFQFGFFPRICFRQHTL